MLFMLVCEVSFVLLFLMLNWCFWLSGSCFVIVVMVCRWRLFLIKRFMCFVSRWFCW